LRLTNFRITNFRSIENSGDVPMERELIKLGDVIGTEEAEMEDIMSPDFYLRLVQGVGREDSTRAIYGFIQADRWPDVAEDPRITRRIDTVLVGFNQNRLDQLPPVLYFGRHRHDLLGAVDEGTISRPASLFAAANAAAAGLA